MTMQLKRRQSSGFVKYPKAFPKRIVDGTARYRTKCDMLVGPCSCGANHQEHDGWVRRLLQQHEAVIDQLALAPEDDGRTLIPKYWTRPRGHESCDTLLGGCACGKRHTVEEEWVHLAVAAHCSHLVGVEIPERFKMIEAPDNPRMTLEEFLEREEGVNGANEGCDCDSCRDRRVQYYENNY
jgi:hypothetical protein